MNEITLHTPASARMNAAQLDALRQAVQRDIDTGRMYGAAMIVARSGKPVLRETFGTVDGSRPTRLDDLYLMMSAAKSFTAMLTLSAIENGCSSWIRKSPTCSRNLPRTARQALRFSTC